VSSLQVRRLLLTDVRNYAHAEVAFPGGVIALVGPNGQGKTNLVEAIGYLATLGSHRVAADAPLIRHDTNLAVIAAEVVRDDRALTVEVQLHTGAANKARINGANLPRVRDVLGIVRTVVFAPEDLALVKGDPGDRRRFLDDVTVQRAPRLAGVRADYDRVLKQRNALLKSAGGARRANVDAVETTLGVWDEQLVDLAAEIISARHQVIDELKPITAQRYRRIVSSGNDDQAASPLHDLGMSYSTSIGTDPGADIGALKLALQELVHQRRREELDRGITLVGPHRDDMVLTLGNAPVKGYASHGESWSVALALRLATYDLFVSEGATPILILDDVFAELDSRRRAHLAESVSVAPQAFITAAVDDDVPAGLAATWFDVRKDDQGIAVITRRGEGE
jgi:DNA replication and repair protein RecF